MTAARRRILVLNERDPAHPQAGGAEIHVERIFSRLAARGHDVLWMATGFPDGADESESAGLRIERQGPLARYYATIVPRVRAAVRREGIDVIVECLNKVPFYTPLYTSVPTLAICHHLFGETAFSQAPLPIALGVVVAESGIARAYRRCPFLAISESTAADLRARGLAPDQIQVSPPGIDPPAHRVDPAAPRPPRIAYVGRLERYKRIDHLLRAAALLSEEIPELEVLVVGKGAERENLEDLAASLGIAGRTRFTGFVENLERDALIAGTRVCVLPSEKEGWGLTVIEANALGTPVVANDAPGLRDSVRDGETGALVDGTTGSEREIVQRYARAIADWMGEDAEAVARRARCLSWAERFDWDRAALDVEAALEDAIAGADA